MAASHTSRHVQRAIRLSSLLRGFSLPQEVLATADRQAILASMKAEYFRRAKEQHPDLVPEERKQDASAKFKVLHQDFSEASLLLEEGVLPSNVPLNRAGAAEAEAAYGATIRQPVYRYDQAQEWSSGPRYPVVRKPDFDTFTRVKCNVIFWSGLFAFFAFMREFLVWSAGSTYAWSRPADLNPFWIRRFQNDWSDKAVQDRKPAPKGSAEAVKAAKVEEKVQQISRNKDRGLDDFYKKRHISNVKKRYTPRGHGGVQM